MLLCEIQSGWEASYLVNGHTVEISAAQLAETKMQSIAAVTVLKNKTAMISKLDF